MRRVSTNDIRATEPDDVWFNVRFSELNLHLNTAFGAWSIPLSVLRSLLAHWGGIAGMVGGVLWMALFALLQLHDTILYAEHPSEGWLGSTSFEIFQILSVLDIRLLGAPL